MIMANPVGDYRYWIALFCCGSIGSWNQRFHIFVIVSGPENLPHDWKNCLESSRAKELRLSHHTEKFEVLLPGSRF